MLRSALRAYYGLREQLDTNLLGPNGHLWATELKKFLRKEPCWIPEAGVTTKEGILRRIARDLSLPACHGLQILTGATEFFSGHIDPDFKRWGFDQPVKPTNATTVAVYELAKDAPFIEIFGSFGIDVDRLCLTQHQIRVFCEKYRPHLCGTGSATMFLAKDGQQHYVIHVAKHPNGFHVYLTTLGDALKWAAEQRHRVVVPGLHEHLHEQ